MTPPPEHPLPAPRGAPPRPRRLVVIGASTGGPAALARLLAAVPRGLPLAFAVAQHMAERFTAPFAARLGRRTGLDVREAAHGDVLAEGSVLVAPGGKHLRVARAGPFAPLRAVIDAPEPRGGPRYCPSVDALFASAAEAMGARLCAVVLTGMGDDGCRGVLRVKEAGGVTLAECEASAVVFGMPGEALQTGKVDEALSIEGLAARLGRFAEGG